MAAFEEMGVLPQISKRLEEIEWILPTDVQAEAVPLILGGGDVLMAAETGSGKTGAFSVPILQIVWETIKDIQTKKKPSNNSSKVDDVPEVWQLSKFDRAKEMAIAEDGITCQSRDQYWNGVRGVKSVHGRGKYFYEATVSDEGLCRVGWSTKQVI